MLERVVELWHYDLPTKAAPPGIGAERRALIATSEAGGNTGTFVTLDQSGGLPIEGPFTGIPLTDHAPVMIGTTVFVVTKIGSIVALDLAGQTKFMKAPIGGPAQTSPLLAVGDELRYGTASGLVVALDAATGDVRWQAALNDPVLNRPAAGPSGRTYAGTDLGRVVGLDGTGQIVFDQNVAAPAGACAVLPSGDVAIAAGDGLSLFSPSGTLKWKHPRAARVVGATALGDDVLAYGEDGLFERLDVGGNVKLSFRSRPASDMNPPPFYAAPLPLPKDGFGLLDGNGTAHLIDSTAKEHASFQGSVDILSEVGVSAVNSILVADKSSIRAIQFVQAVE